MSGVLKRNLGGVLAVLCAVALLGCEPQEASGAAAGVVEFDNAPTTLPSTSTEPDLQPLAATPATTTTALAPAATAAVTAPPVTAPPVTAPAATAPPLTSPPVTAPPVTAPPVTAPPATMPPVQAPQPLVVIPQNNGCDPHYTGCVPIDSDVDCAGGTGNGPSYAHGPVNVIGSDIYDLDRDGDGVACQNG
jgi:hypothetical protein